MVLFWSVCCQRPQMVAARDKAGGDGLALLQPALDAPVRNRPARAGVTCPVIRRAARPSRLKPFRRGGQFGHAFGFRQRHGFRIRSLRSTVKVGAEVPPLKPEPVLDRCLRHADGDEVVFRRENLPVRPGKMRLQHCEDIAAREDIARLNSLPHRTHRLITTVRNRQQASPGPFGLEFYFPVWPDKIPAPRWIFRIGPAKRQIHQIAKRPPVIRGGPERRRRVRIVAINPLTHMNRTRQRHIHLQPPGMGVRGDIGGRSRIGWNTRPQRLEEQIQRQINLPAQARVTCVEGVHINVGRIKRHQAEPVFPLEGQGGDFAA